MIGCKTTNQNLLKMNHEYDDFSISRSRDDEWRGCFVTDMCLVVSIST
jgi:hypothetical protein